MHKDIINLFARYNQVTNETMNEIIKTLSPEEWDKNLGGFFKSVRELCSHLYICDFNWLKRLSKLRTFAALEEAPLNREPFSFSEILFAGMDEYLSKRPALDETLIRFAGEISENDLAAVLKYSDSGGKEHERIFGGLVMQCLNHETHHRGMISLYLEMLGRENDFSGLVKILK